MLSARFCGVCRISVKLESAQATACPQCGTTFVEWSPKQTVTLDWRNAADDETDGDAADPFLGRAFDKYRIERFLGQGGMARVYLAQDQALERPCAIKILRPDKSRRGESVLDCFLAEARAAAALVHPNVVHIHTLGTNAGEEFIEMEYIDGRSLSDVIKAARGMHPFDATRFMVQISSALAAAHRMGMIHRDIKPANVMVTSAGDAKLADFGLAKRLTGKRTDLVPLSGTPSFMAPELFTGARASKQSDVYAMGVTYFALLTASLPVSTKALSELIRFHAQREAPDLSRLADTVPASVVDVIETCLAREPDRRFHDALELHNVLRALFGRLRSLESLVGEALANQPVELRTDGNRMVARVPLPNGRFQTVWIQIVTSQTTGHELVEIFSIAGTAVAAEYERVLKLNAKLSHGAIAIDEIDGQNRFVLVNNYPRATCDPEEVRSSVVMIAAEADAIEKRLSNEDRY